MTEKEAALEGRIAALEIETEALRAALRFLLYKAEFGGEGEARWEAQGWRESLEEEWRRAAERR